MKGSVYFALCILFLLPSLVYGAGISGNDLDPEVIFEPGKKFTFAFNGIANNLHDGLDYSVTLKGDELKPYVTLEEEFWEDLPKKKSVPIIGHINFPAELPPPQQYLRVCFMEGCGGEGMICGRTAACAKVIVMVPYEGVYPKIKLNAPNINVDETAYFSVNVQNAGTGVLGVCTGHVLVSDLDGKEVGTAKLSGAETIASYKKKSMTAELDSTGLKPGNYSAKAIVTCDGILRENERTFRIGTLDVKIIDYTRELSRGGIKRFVTKIESAWNDPLEDVRASIRIFDDDEDNSISANTANIRLEPWKTADLEAFIDTSGLEVKKYDVSIDVIYADKKSHIDGEIDIVPGPEEIDEDRLGRVEEPSGSLNATMITTILVVIVILLTVFNIIIALRRKR